MKRVLLLGCNGQVGWELQRSLALLGTLLACDRQQADLSDPPRLEQLLRSEKPDIGYIRKLSALKDSGTMTRMGRNRKARISPTSPRMP